MKSTTLNAGVDDEKMNRKHQSTLANNKKDTGGDVNVVKQQPHDKPPSGNNPVGAFDGNLMGFTDLLEAMDSIKENLDSIEGDGDILDASIPSTSPINSGGDEELLDALNQFFTPILVRQGFEGSIADKIQESYSEADVITEMNIMKFDDATRMSQLLSVCALLIAKQKNTQQYQMYAKASQIRKSMKLEIQKSEYAAAQALATKYLVKVSTTNGSKVARQAANDLLPETNH